MQETEVNLEHCRWVDQGRRGRASKQATCFISSFKPYAHLRVKNLLQVFLCIFVNWNRYDRRNCRRIKARRARTGESFGSEVRMNINSRRKAATDKNSVLVKRTYKTTSQSPVVAPVAAWVKCSKLSSSRVFKALSPNAVEITASNAHTLTTTILWFFQLS